MGLIEAVRAFILAFPDGMPRHVYGKSFYELFKRRAIKRNEGRADALESRKVFIIFEVIQSGTD